MKRLIEVLLLGKVVETVIILLILAVSFVWGFYDSFYNQTLIKRLIGYQIPGGGFSLSIIIALILGSMAQTDKGWKDVEEFLFSKEEPLLTTL
mgnify:CR=1 FL=1